MNNLNAGALRSTNKDERSARIKAATDLVQRTLAQHGLSGQTGGSENILSALPRPDFGSLMNKLMPSFGSASGQHVHTPAGATLRSEAFTNDAGSRSFQTYVPETAKDGLSGLVVMLHGCTQTAEDFAAGTGMNALAEQHRFVVVYPQQSRGDNMQTCWNWFRRGDQMHGRGEPSVLAGIAAQVSGEFGLPRDKTFVAGLSAGGAMAVILGETYPDVFSAVGSHSGLSFGAAKDVQSAFEAMSGRGNIQATATGNAEAVRTITFHGSADTTVHPVNSDQITKRLLECSGSMAIERDETYNIHGRTVNSVTATTPDGKSLYEQWTVDGLGHAWSGGRPEGSYTDAKGPDASKEMIRFFFDSE